MLMRIWFCLLAGLAVLWGTAASQPVATWPTSFGDVAGTSHVQYGGPGGLDNVLQAGSAQLGQSVSLAARAVTQCLAANVDGDDNPEIVLLHGGGTELSVLDADLHPLRHVRFAKRAMLVGLTDVTGDGRAEIIVGHRSDSPGGRLSVFDGTLKRVAEVPLRPGPTCPAARFEPAHIVDLDGDGHQDIICTFSETPAAWGVARFSYPEGRLEWAQHTAGDARPPALADLIGDGDLEIIVPTYAVGNGVEAQGRNDSRSYFAVLDYAGRCIWMSSDIGGYFTEARVAVVRLRPKDRPCVVSWTRTASAERTDSGCLVLYGPEGHELAREVFPVSILGLVAGDFVGDARPEFVAGLADGTVRLLDTRLRLLSQVGFPGHHARALAGGDLDRDGKTEVVVAVSGDLPTGVTNAGTAFPRPNGSDTAAVRQPCLGILDFWPWMSWTSGPVPWQFQAAAEPPVSARLLQCPDDVYPRLLAFSPVGGDPPLLSWSIAPNRPAFRGSAHALSAPRDVRGFAVASRGPWIAIVSGPQRTLTLLDSAANRVADVPGCTGATGLRWAPNGTDLAFTATTSASSGEPALHLLRAGSPVPRVLATSPVALCGDWAADGKSMVVTVAPDEDEQGRLEVVTISGGGRRALTDRAGRPVVGAWPRLDGHAENVYFVGEETLPTTSQGPVRARLLKCLDLGTRQVTVVDDPRAVAQAVERARATLPSSAPFCWTGRDLLAAVVGPPEWDPARECLAFPQRLIRLDRGPATSNPRTYPGIPDLWCYDTRNGRLARLTADDEGMEVDPSWSASGNWLAFVARPVDDAQPSHVMLCSRTGSSVVDLGPGSGVGWGPGAEHTVVVIRGGQLCSISLAPDLPQIESPRGPMRGALGGGVVGLLLSMALLKGRLIQRGRRAWMLVATASRAARLGFDPPTLKRLVGLLAELDNTLHSLKNGVFIIPGDAATPAQFADIEFCLDPENVQAIERLSHSAIDQIDRLARDESLFRQAVSDFSGRTRDAFGRAMDAVLDRRAALQRGLERLARHAGEFERYRQLEGEAQREAIGRAAADLNELYNLIDGPEGLRRHVLRALESVTLDGALRQAAQVMSRRAAEVGVELSVPPEGYRTRVCGDPTPLVDVFVGVLANALDALEKQREVAGPAFAPQLSIALDGTSPIAVRISDNGCGIPEGVLRQLRSGLRVTTKQAGRGTGLARAREVLVRRYPQGALEIESGGEAKGAEITITIGTA